MLTPICERVSILRRWILLNGASRAKSTSFRCSLSVTSAARRIKLSEYPQAIPATVFMLHGTMIMPSVRKVPLDMEAAISCSS